MERRRVVECGNFDSTAGGTLITAVDMPSRHFLYDTASGNLYYDADGSGVKAAVQFTTLTGHPTLVASDLLIGLLQHGITLH
jgi:Ca2+-binding RTX toxin-like protein